MNKWSIILQVIVGNFVFLAPLFGDAWLGSGDKGKTIGKKKELGFIIFLKKEGASGPRLLM